MKTYDDLRDLIISGDVALVEGHGFFHALIRIFTGQQISHIGLFLWLPQGGLFVAEMLGRGGYRLTPASQRIPEMLQEGYVYWGTSPAALHLVPDCVRGAALAFRAFRYSYPTLVKVWIAQLWRRRVRAELVCSTFVQRVWEACGYEFAVTADPGEFMHHCGQVVRIVPAPATVAGAGATAG